MVQADRLLEHLPPEDRTEVERLMEKIRSDGVFRGGIGTYNTFVHVDTRGENANWTG